MLLGQWRQPLLTFQAMFTSQCTIHTSAALSSWGGGKLKTHTGTAKRFKPVGNRRGNVNTLKTGIGIADGEPYTSQLIYDVAPTKSLGPMFKRGRTGKQHLNGKMSHSQISRLRGTKVHESGHTIRTLNRLIGSHL